MTREIKFRAWIEIHRYMIYSGATRGLDYMVFNPNGKIIIGEGDGDQQHQNVPVMQSTGHKDKNGKEIYEGDIIDIQKGLGRVVTVWNSMYDLLKYIEDNTEAIEVIGNIYDNPELIDKK